MGEVVGRDLLSEESFELRKHHSEGTGYAERSEKNHSPSILRFCNSIKCCILQNRLTSSSCRYFKKLLVRKFQSLICECSRQFFKFNLSTEGVSEPHFFPKKITFFTCFPTDIVGRRSRSVCFSKTNGNCVPLRRDHVGWVDFW